MPTETCCCGNTLREDTVVSIRVSPCACAQPGPYRRQVTRFVPVEYISENQYRERTTLGLSLVNERERGVFEDAMRRG